MDLDRPGADLTAGTTFWRAAGGGIAISVRLTPRGGSDRIDGEARDAEGHAYLAARVRAVAEDGRANAALLRLVAARLDLPRSRVAIVAGHQSRRKELRIDAAPADLSDRLAALGAGPRRE